MAYESKVIIVNVHRVKDFPEVVYAERIAEVNLSCMGYNNGWRELFDREIDYQLYMDDGNTMFDTDRYGDHMKSCPVERVVTWLEEAMKTSTYRRLPVLYGLLNGFIGNQWKCLEVVHYGY